MENKLLEEKHQRKLLQDCTEQVSYYTVDDVVCLLTTCLYGFKHKTVT